MQIYDSIPERLFAFIRRSHLFFVATAPIGQGGSVNVSPKSSNGAFEIVNKNRVRYLDFTGSGNETISHLLQQGNGRITIMFVNIEEGPPNIIRFYGKASVHERLISGSESKFDQVVSVNNQQQSPPLGTRALIDIAIHTCTTSCGYSVPIYKYVKERQTLTDWARNMEESKDMEAMKKRYKKDIPSGDLYLGEKVKGRPVDRWIEAYWVLSNALSIDGLPGMKIAQNLTSEEEKEAILKKKEVTDKLEPPKDDAGPFQPVSIVSTTSTATATVTTSSNNDTLYLFIAFSIGCALTTSIFLAPRVMGM